MIVPDDAFFPIHEEVSVKSTYINTLERKLTCYLICIWVEPVNIEPKDEMHVAVELARVQVSVGRSEVAQRWRLQDVGVARSWR